MTTPRYRPSPPPLIPWVMSMRWESLAFLHWPVAHDVLRPMIPSGLELQTREGAAWLGITPLRMSRVRARLTPPVPRLSSFPELNLRTYVAAGGRPGIWFFSLDAGSRLAVSGARLTFGLPYHTASMGISRENGSVRYHSVRKGAPHGEARFRGSYRPTCPVRAATPGTLEHWLTERYCLYSVRGGRLLRGEIHHSPWPLQTASAEIEENTIALPIGIRLAGPPPLAHFARRLDVKAWPPLRIGG